MFHVTFVVVDRETGTRVPGFPSPQRWGDALVSLRRARAGLYPGAVLVPFNLPGAAGALGYSTREA